MRAILLLVILLFGCSHSLFAQDSIRTIKGLTLVGELKRVSPYEVSFVKYGKNGRKARSNSSGNYLTSKLSASEIAEIVYADGRRDSLLPLPELGADTAGRYFSKQEFYRLGSNDAKLYYRKSTGATLTTFLFTFPISPLAGLVVAAGTSATAPSPRRFTFPNPELASNEDYKRGYAQRAHKLKAGRVWTAWCAGAVLTVATVLIMESLTNK